MKHPYLISPRDLFPRNSWTMSWRNCKKRIKRRSLRCQAKIGASTPPRLIVTRFFTHESCNKKQRIWRFRYHLRKIPTTYSAKLKKLCDFVVEVKKGLPKNLQIFFLQELGDWWCVQDKSLGFGWEKKTRQDLGLGALGRPMVLDFLILALNTSVFFWKPIHLYCVFTVVDPKDSLSKLYISASHRKNQNEWFVAKKKWASTQMALDTHLWVTAWHSCLKKP